MSYNPFDPDGTDMSPREARTYMRREKYRGKARRKAMTELDKLTRDYAALINDRDEIQSTLTMLLDRLRRPHPNGPGWLDPVSSAREIVEERDKLRKENRRLERTVRQIDEMLEDTIDDCDRYSAALAATHRALGGDGEWVTRSPPVEPPESGDLARDVLVLAARFRRDRDDIWAPVWEILNAEEDKLSLDVSGESYGEMLTRIIRERDEARDRVALMQGLPFSSRVPAALRSRLDATKKSLGEMQAALSRRGVVLGVEGIRQLAEQRIVAEAERDEWERKSKRNGLAAALITESIAERLGGQPNLEGILSAVSTLKADAAEGRRLLEMARDSWDCFCPDLEPEGAAHGEQCSWCQINAFLSRTPKKDDLGDPKPPLVCPECGWEWGGEEPREPSEVEKLQKAVALLHSMVEGGEPHSEQSREVVRAALAPERGEEERDPDFGALPEHGEGDGLDMIGDEETGEMN